MLLILIGTSCNLFPPQSGEPGSTSQAAPATRVAVLSTPSPAPGQASPAATGRPIVFLKTDIAGNPNVLSVINPDGSGLRSLPLDDAHPEKYISTCPPRPALSPDGRYLAVSRSPFREDVAHRQEGELPVKVPREPRELVVIELATGKVAALTGAYGGSFDWSPDSQRILHTRPIEWDLDTSKPEPDQGLWVLNLDNGEDSQMIPPQADFPIASVDWSPDGARIAFHGAALEGMGPFGTANIDGSGFKIWEDAIGSFDWSPDGARIAYDEVMNVAFPPARLFLTNADGSSSNIIVDDKSKIALQPEWSPDRQSIAFIDGLEGNSSVWLVEANGANLRQVSTPRLAQIDSLAWSLDGARLLVSGGNQIYLVPLDGSPPVWLASGACPSW